MKKPLLTEAEINILVETLAWRINNDYMDIDKPPVFVVVANAAILFASDLFKEFYSLDENFNFFVDVVKPSSYDIKTNLQKTFDINVDINVSLIEGSDVIIVDTVYDSGQTVKKLKDICILEGASSVELCILAAKNLTDFNIIKYLGVNLITESFLAGYGLDNKGLNRNHTIIYEVEN
jgi:hypoxanthine phosphoribosyltransferase